MTPLGPVGAFVALLVVGFVGAPWLVAALRSTTTPGAATWERIERLRDRAGLDVRGALVLDTDDEETAAVYVRGPPGYRRLFVTTTFLDRFDDGVVTALLAAEAGTGRARVDALRC